MQQSPLLNRSSLDPFPFQQNGRAAPEVDIDGRHVLETLLVAPVIVDELVGLQFEIVRQE